MELSVAGQRSVAACFITFYVASRLMVTYSGYVVASG